MSEQAPPKAAEGREQISPLSIEEGDAKIDNAAARFAKKQKRRRCLSITAVVLISLSAAAALVEARPLPGVTSRTARYPGP